MGNVMKNKSIRALIILGIVMAILGIGGYVALGYLKEQKKEPLKEEDKYVGEPIDGVKASGLTTGLYYIKHGDYYYPLSTAFIKNYDETDDNGTDCRRIISMSEDEWQKVPTLYLGRDDKLVFYSQNVTRSYIDYERFTDEGTSIGIYNLTKDEYSGLYSISIKDKSERYKYINEASSASILSKDFKPNSDNDFTYLTIGSIGKHEISDKIMSKSGIIKGLVSGKSYKVAVYNGTVKNDYVFSADTHYLSGMEHFREANVPLIDGVSQEIEIPDYFLDGYYCIDQSGLVRVVRESDYTDDTDFNTRLLEITKVMSPDSSLNDEKVESEVNATALYSTIPAFNKYTAYTPGSFAYGESLSDDSSSDTDSDNSSGVIEIDSTTEEVTDSEGRRGSDTTTGMDDADNSGAASSSTSNDTDTGSDEDTDSTSDDETSDDISSDTNGPRERH